MSLAVSLLQRLIRHETVNPPGNERVLQEELAHDLRAAGLRDRTRRSHEERPNLVATLRGDSPGPVLGLLSPRGHGPRRAGRVATRSMVRGSGRQGDLGSRRAGHEVSDGRRGRRGDRARPGRAGPRVRRAEADRVRRRGDRWRVGAQWLCENEPDLARCDYLINEGAGRRDARARSASTGCAQRRRASSASRSPRTARPATPRCRVADNALPKLGAALIALADNRPS